MDWHRFISEILFAADIYVPTIVYSVGLRRSENYAARMLRAALITLAVALAGASFFSLVSTGNAAVDFIIKEAYVILLIVVIERVLHRCRDIKRNWFYFVVMTSVLTWFVSDQTYNLISAIFPALVDITGSMFWVEIIIRIGITAIYCVLLRFPFAKLFVSYGNISIDLSVTIIHSLFIALIITGLSILQIPLTALGRGWQVISCALCIVFCLAALSFSIYIIYMMHKFADEQTLAQLKDKQMFQYKLTAEAVDIINIKVHDLKHRIKGLGSDDVETEEALDIYENSYDTGNAILDAVLTDKGMICKAKGVDLTVSVDKSAATALSVMHDEDICYFFGNALENAMEYEFAHAEAGESRYIELRLKCIGRLLSVVVENMYEGSPIPNTDILPRTTKADDTMHGFGLRSMKRITAKYGGTFAVRAGDGSFTVSALFPINDVHPEK